MGSRSGLGILGGKGGRGIWGEGGDGGSGEGMGICLTTRFLSLPT